MNAREMFVKIAEAFVELYNYVRGPMVPQAIQLRDAVVKIHESLAGQIADSELISSVIEWFNTFHNIYVALGLVGLVISFVLGLLWKVLAVVVSALGVWISYLIWRDHNWHKLFLTDEKGLAFFASTWLGLLLLYRAQGLLGKVCLLGIETLVIWVMQYSMSTTTNMEIPWDDSNIHEIISRAVPPVPHYSSPHDLYRSLCASPIFLDDGYLSLAYDRATGKKCWMMGARLLLIDLAEIPDYWNWISLPESRFSQVAELRFVRRLKIKGSISTYMLSPRTTYVAYFVYKFSNTSRSGFHERPVSLRVVRVVNTQRQVVAHHNRVFLIGEMASQARTRSDGWMEIEFGEISYIDDSATIECILEGSESFEGKRSLIVEGIELRPR
ncbi:PREDICTED: F-box protein PP2-B10-like isoform X1 [Fragaria vesca subsp. vesca]|uniref:F-box protein PP2-B10-like isoform X1 n=1 Tax=Fragaria vesca subsp. vesca TaxID=101020 RepID=UPI0002C35934|nr:PREDICTED: F-box protein PP2-B10-like isoform X1 [Fragaria vesca subsp. vesca]